MIANTAAETSYRHMGGTGHIPLTAMAVKAANDAVTAEAAGIIGRENKRRRVDDSQSCSDTGRAKASDSAGREENTGSLHDSRTSDKASSEAPKSSTSKVSDPSPDASQ